MTPDPIPAIRQPIPLKDEKGKVRAWACAYCRRVKANISCGGESEKARMSEAEHSHDDAARCCVCDKCGTLAPDKFGSTCESCRQAEAERAETPNPEREAAHAAYLAQRAIHADASAKKLLAGVDRPDDWYDYEDLATLTMPVILAAWDTQQTALRRLVEEMDIRASVLDQNCEREAEHELSVWRSKVAALLPPQAEP